MKKSDTKKPGCPQEADPRWGQIVTRIEKFRVSLSMSKSEFASELGLTSQTYNNFTGHQGSKPSLKLILALCSAGKYGLNPAWVLFGTLPTHRGIRARLKTRTNTP